MHKMRAKVSVVPVKTVPTLQSVGKQFTAQLRDIGPAAEAALQNGEVGIRPLNGLGTYLGCVPGFLLTCIASGTQRDADCAVRCTHVVLWILNTGRRNTVFDEV